MVEQCRTEDLDTDQGHHRQDGVRPRDHRLQQEAGDGGQETPAQGGGQQVGSGDGDQEETKDGDGEKCES